MRVTVEFCRQQERLQRAKAESEPLENRKKIALDAAKAWAAEAMLAKKRDAKQAPLDKLDAQIALEFARETDAETGE
jgi:hypothetical protein